MIKNVTYLVLFIVLALSSTWSYSQERSFLLGINSEGYADISYIQEEPFLRFELSACIGTDYQLLQTKMIFQKNIEGMDFGISVPYLKLKRSVDLENKAVKIQKKTPIEFSMRYKINKLWIITSWDLFDKCPKVGLRLKL